jgi:hypothetical protein
VSHYTDYKAAFDKARAALAVPADCTARSPSYRVPGDLVDPKSWDFSWWLEFTDNTYVVCHEIWVVRNAKPVRHFFSFHYGPIVRRDANGKIDRSHSNALVLRICKNGRDPLHLHFKQPHPAPHYEQGKVVGLVLEKVDMFQFVKAVFCSKAEGIDLDNAMGFTLK